MKGITPYQLEILQHVAAAADAGDTIDFDQLLDKLSWTPSKESAQFTIRACIKKLLLKKGDKLMLRRGRQRVIYILTPAGIQVLDPRQVSSSKPVEVQKTVPAVFLEALDTDPGIPLDFVEPVFTFE